MTFLGPDGVPLRDGPSKPPVGRGVWALAIGLSVLWLVSVVTLALVALRGELSGELILGAIVQLIATGYGAPALWFWWRRLLERRAADGPRPPEVGGPGGTHLSLHGEVPPPTRW